MSKPRGAILIYESALEIRGQKVRIVYFLKTISNIALRRKMACG
jgi:hypothetical protein